MNRKMAVIGGAVLALGSLSIAFSSTPRHTDPAPRAMNRVPAQAAVAPQAAYATADDAGMPDMAPAEAMAPAAMTNARLELVPPPADLPRAKSMAMVTSVSPMAPAQTVSAQGAASAKVAKAAGKSAGKASDQMAAVAKPKRLFSYVRMLEFGPHPTEEEFLRDKPLQLHGKNYHFTVNYDEKWAPVGEESGDLKKIGFQINLLENGKPCRTLKIPQVAVNAKSLHKGMVLGLAQVAPYNFKIVVDSFKVRGKAVSELVFRFDLTS